MGSNAKPTTQLMQKLKEAIEHKFPEAGAELERRGIMSASSYSQMWSRPSLQLKTYCKLLDILEIHEGDFLSGAKTTDRILPYTADIINLVDGVLEHWQVVDETYRDHPELWKSSQILMQRAVRVLNALRSLSRQEDSGTVSGNASSNLSPDKDRQSSAEM